MKLRQPDHIRKDAALGAEEQYVEELAALAIAGAGIASNLDVAQSLQIIAQQLTRLLDVPICLLSEWQPEQTGLHTSLTYIHPDFAGDETQVAPQRLADKLSLSVAEQRVTLQVPQAGTATSRKDKLALKRAAVHTVLLVPLVAQNRLVGVIELHETRQPRQFTDREVYLAQTLCHQAAIAVENARLLGATSRQLQELSILYHVSTAATEATNEDELILRTTDLIRDSLYPDNFGVLLLNPDENHLEIHPSYQSRETIQSTVNLGQGVTGKVAKTGKPQRVADVRKLKNYLGYDSLTLSELCVPMKIGNRIIGVINAESQKRNHFSEKDERILLTFAGQLASGIERMRNAAAEARRARQLTVLNKLTGEMSGVLDREQLFEIVVQRLNQEMQYTSTDIALVDEANQEYWVVQAAGTFAPLMKARGGYRQPFGVGLLGQAATSGQPVVANNVHQRPGYLLVEGHESIHSELVIPIKIYKRVVALLNIESEQPNAFDSHEVAALTALSEQISVALESIELFDSTRRQLQELTVLHSISQAALNARSEEELLERATEVIGDSIYPDQFGFLLLEPGGEHLVVNHSYRGISDEVKRRRVHLSQGVVGKVASSGKSWRVPDVRKEPNYLNVSKTMRSELCVPLLNNNQRVLGVINAESAQLDAFSDRDLRLLSTIANQIATAIEKLRLLSAERAQRQQAETLREVAALLNSETDKERVLRLILEQLNHVVPFEGASIQIREGANLRVQALAGAPNTDLLGTVVSLEDDRVLHPIIFQHETLMYGNVHKEPEWIVRPGIEHIVSWIGAPLVARGRCIGLLTVDGYQENQFTHKDAQLVSVFAAHAAIALENAHLFEDAQEAYVQTVTALASAIDVRDSYTSGHSRRLADLAVMIGEQLGCNEDEKLDILWAGLLHDIGKIGVPDEILRKPGDLTVEEEAIMRRHPEIGAQIVEGVKYLEGVAPIIRAHQERYDGLGYPDELKGEDIPWIARIISVADAYVAMTDDRVYRKSMSHEEALDELKAHSGTQFDPRVVAAFLELASKPSWLDD